MLARAGLLLLSTPFLLAALAAPADAALAKDDPTPAQVVQAMSRGIAYDPAWLSAVARGHHDARFRLGVCHWYGRGVPRDQARARTLWRAAAAGQHAKAQTALAATLVREPRSEREAGIWVREAAGDEPWADLLMGVMTIDGVGVRQDARAGIGHLGATARAGLPAAALTLGDRYRRGAGVPADLEWSTRWYGEAARAGDPAGMVALGRAYLEGNGVAADAAMATTWFERAALLGNHDGEAILGAAHLDPTGKVDGAKAAEWLGKAAAANHVAAMYLLGCLLWDGNHVPRDTAEGTRWLDRAAAAGGRKTALEVAHQYESGPNPDRERALAAYRLAALRGDGAAAYYVGVHYRDGINVDPSPALAARYFGLAATRGDGDGWLAWGRALANGRGVKRNDRQAFLAFRHALDRGITAAYGELAMCYQQGRGVARDPGIAAKYDAIAERANLPGARRRMGLRYLSADGVKRDVPRGLALLARGADPVAARTLGRMYEVGDGVPMDAAKAFRWYDAAAPADGVAAYKTAIAYATGRGTAASSTQAITRFQAAIQKGHQGALTDLATYVEREAGDQPKALALRRQAAARGIARGQFALGQMYAQGQGVPRDASRAFALCSLAAHQGDAEAEAWVAESFRIGRGVGRDRAEAARWARRAALHRQRTVGWTLAKG